MEWSAVLSPIWFPLRSNPLLSAPSDFTLCLGPLMVFFCFFLFFQAMVQIDNIFQEGTEWMGGHPLKGQEGKIKKIKQQSQGEGGGET